MTGPTTADAPRRSRPLILAAAAVVAVILAGGLALALRDGDDDLPVLDLGAAPQAQGAPMADSADGAGDERMAEGTAATSMAVWARYVAGDDLPDLGGSAPVYRLAADDDDLRRVAEHLGVQGDVTDADGQQRQIVDGDASASRDGASFWYTSGEPYPGQGDAGVSSGCVAPDAPPGAEPAMVDCPEPEPMPEPERPADLPSQAEAEDIIRAVAEAAGLDLTGARVTSYDNVVTWGVNIELALDGVVVPGWSVYGTVMEGGKVLDAGGAMGRLETLGDYPLDTTRAAIDRLNEQMGGMEPTETEPGTDEPVQVDPMPAADTPVSDGGGVSGDPGAADSDVSSSPADPGQTEPAPAPDDVSILPVDSGEPVTVTLRSAELSWSMAGNADGTETYLVPTYLLDGEDDQGQAWEDVYAIAVSADLLGG